MVPIKRKERKKSFSFPFPRAPKSNHRAQQKKNHIPFDRSWTNPFSFLGKPVQMVHLGVVVFFSRDLSKKRVSSECAANKNKQILFGTVCTGSWNDWPFFSLRLLIPHPTPVRFTFQEWSRTDATWNYGSFGFMLTRISGWRFRRAEGTRALILN